MKNISILILSIATGVLSARACAADMTATAQSFAQASLLGIQLAIKQGHQSGKVPAATADCVATFKPDVFVEVFDKLMKTNLTEDEQQATETFFKSTTGAKYVKLNQIQVYQSMGQQAPDPVPDFSSAEIAEVESFSKTPAGGKLKALQMPAAMAPVNQRIKELLSQCPRQ